MQRPKPDAAARVQRSPRRERFEELARQVRDDARREPEAYVRDTEVPGGGE